MNLNDNFKLLPENYLFSTISQKRQKYMRNNPSKEIISLGIGDVSLPIPEVCVQAIKEAANDLSKIETFKGYGPEQGYEFLRKKISNYDYKDLNISSDEIFISDGTKCDLTRIIELFAYDNVIAIPNPVYPVYLDSNIIYGKINYSNNLIYLPITEENNFTPSLPTEKVDIIYLCSPNNPTGAVLSKETLTQFVEYALLNNSIILYDSAYEAFIQDSSIPHSIYEIPNAQKVSIEFRSFSKTAGFTGIRCGYVVIPKELEINGVHLINLYKRLISTTFNGASYISQKAAAALYSNDGRNQINQNIKYYLNNAKIIKNEMLNLNISCCGGDNSPYIWLKIPNSLSSWEFFDLLLNRSQIIGTPGVGFGEFGEGYFRLSAFNSLENTQKATDKFKQIFN